MCIYIYIYIYIYISEHSQNAQNDGHLTAFRNSAPRHKDVH